MARKWTLMFYFASDNPLAPSMISQLKAIKDAGYQQDTDVVVFFDPNEPGLPSMLFEMNRKKRARPGAKPSLVGDGKDSYVRNVIEDLIKVKSPNSRSQPLTDELATKLLKADELPAKDALRLFLGFCKENYESEHYMLFLMGHGMIVASDEFLPDENPKGGISLEELGNILRTFSSALGAGGTLELVGMPSCSMSAIEVVYQLSGTANYMLASQGLSFVGSWPYRQIIKKIFNTIERSPDKVDVLALLTKLSQHCVHGSTDFALMGYPADLSICKLTEADVRALDKPLLELVEALRNGLKNDKVRDIIILAHWRSQSFWEEIYTDLFDFCLCLWRACEDDDSEQGNIKKACGKVMDKLTDPFVHSEHFGQINQFAHGLSIYFPWSKPKEPVSTNKLEAYQKYTFTTKLSENSWFDFLKDYWRLSERVSRYTEENGDKDVKWVGENFSEFLAWDDTLEGTKPDPILGTKPDPTLTKPDPSVGKNDCTCPSIKNYENRTYYTPGVRRAFEQLLNDKDDTDDDNSDEDEK